MADADAGAMDVAYRPEAWHDFYLMVGGAAAVLMGLIFVAVSIHLRLILDDAWLRGRAESALLALMLVLLIAGAVLVPEQPLAALGVEIAVLSLVSPAVSIRGLRHLSGGLRRAPVEIGIGLVGTTVGLLSGASLVVGWGGGLMLLLPAAAVAVVSSVWNGWRLMVDAAAEREDAGRI